MLRTLKLLIPAIIPSWRFFDEIAPSPRIQFVLLHSEHESPSEWQEFRPRPVQLSFLHMLGRIFWNPVWNESLFMVSCAERIMAAPTQHSEDEILKRIKASLTVDNMIAGHSHFQFRLLVVRREGAQLREEVVFRSRIGTLSSKATV